MPSASDPRRENLITMAAAVCLFLASIEYLIPKPLPFIRLGLANLPILVLLDLLSPQQVLLLVLLKVAGQSLVQGSLFSYVFLFSLAGSLASATVMVAVHRTLHRWITLVGISILGAFSSNVVQILLARLLVFGEQAWIIAPPFLLVGLISSTMLGYLALIYRKRSGWLKKIENDSKSV